MITPTKLIKKIVPSSIKTVVKEAIRSRRFAQSFANYCGISRNREPSRAELADLVSAWGNEEYFAREEYLLELIRTARRLDGPVIECGSGLSTLLLGVEAQRRNQKVYSLEHHPYWAARMRRDAVAELRQLLLV